MSPEEGNLSLKGGEEVADFAAAAAQSALCLWNVNLCKQANY